MEKSDIEPPWLMYREKILKKHSEYVSLVESALKIGIRNNDVKRISIIINLLAYFPANDRNKMSYLLETLLGFVNNYNPKNASEYIDFKRYKRASLKKLKGKEDEEIDKGILAFYQREQALIQELENKKQVVVYQIVRCFLPNKNDVALKYALNEHAPSGYKKLNTDYILLYKDNPDMLKSRVHNSLDKNGQLANGFLLEKLGIYLNK